MEYRKLYANKTMDAPPGKIFQLVYVSAATRPFSEADLEDLLEKSRERNRKRDLTGVLLYSEGAFMQALEGAKDTVLALMEKIKADGRHRNLMVLLKTESTTRAFPDFRMGFRLASRKEIAQHEGFSHFLDDDFDWKLVNDPGHRVLTLLKTFKKYN